MSVCYRNNARDSINSQYSLKIIGGFRADRRSSGRRRAGCKYSVVAQRKDMVRVSSQCRRQVVFENCRLQRIRRTDACPPVGVPESDNKYPRSPSFIASSQSVTFTVLFAVSPFAQFRVTMPGIDKIDPGRACGSACSSERTCLNWTETAPAEPPVRETKNVIVPAFSKALAVAGRLSTPGSVAVNETLSIPRP